MCPVYTHAHTQVISVSGPVKVALAGLCDGTRVVSVAAGSAISAILTDKGEVVTWGAVHSPPHRVDTCFGDGEVGVQVAAGGPYALAVTDKTRSVWVWSR